MVSPIYDILLSIQNVLGNAVAPTLRAVTVDIHDSTKKLELYFFYDGVVSEELWEVANLIGTETDHPNYVNAEHILRLDVPEKIPLYGKFAYLRYESYLPKLEKENRAFLLKNKFSQDAIFRLDMQEALLGKVTPSLRYVGVKFDLEADKLITHFIYDGEISEKDRNLAQAAIEESRISFPEYKMDAVIERVDFPQEMVHQTNRLVYWRREWEYIDEGKVPTIKK